MGKIARLEIIIADPYNDYEDYIEDKIKDIMLDNKLLCKIVDSEECEFNSHDKFTWTVNDGKKHTTSLASWNSDDGGDLDAFFDFVFNDYSTDELITFTSGYLE